MDRSSLRKKLVRVDYLGIVLFIGSSTSFLIGLSLGGTQHPWSSAPIVVPLIVGATGFIAFLVVQWKMKMPMMPLIIFVHRTAIAGFVGTFVHGLAIWAYVYYMIVFVREHSASPFIPSDGLIVFQFLDARQHSLLHSSVETLPGGAFTAPSSMMSALIVVRTLHFQKLAWVGWTALVVGFGLDSLLTPDGNNGVLYGLQIIASIGGGMLFPLSNSPYRPHSWTRT